MNEAVRGVFLRVGLFVLCVCASLAFGFWRGCSHARASDADRKRAERYEAGSESAKEAVGKLESGLGSVAEEMRGVGRKIDASLADVGELREIGDRIDGNREGVADAAGRIEEGVQRIEQILLEAKKSGGVLESGGDNGGCDSGR